MSYEIHKMAVLICRKIEVHEQENGVKQVYLTLSPGKRLIEHETILATDGVLEEVGKKAI